MRIERTLVLGLLALLTGCQDSRGPREDRRLDLPEVPAFAVDSVPAVTIGLNPPSEEYVFAEITGGGIVGDSLIVLVDSRLMRVGVYGFDGGFRRWIIREGEGPGEVEWIHQSGVLGDGRVWVYDQAALRLLAVTVDGEVVSEGTIPYDHPFDFMNTDVIGPGADDAWWLRKEPAGTRREEGTILRVPTELLHLDARGKLDTVWSGGGDLRAVGTPIVVNRAGSPRGFTRVRHLPELLFEATGDGVLMAWSDSGFVEYIGLDGTKERVGRFPVRRVPFVDDDPPPPFNEGQRALYRMDRHYPQIDEILVDRDGSPWIYQAPMEEDTEESEVRATLYKLAENGPVASVQSHLPGIAPTMSEDWILIKRSHPETREQYVSLHRLLPVADGRR